MCIPIISGSVLSQILNVSRNSQARNGVRQLARPGNLTQSQTDLVTLSKAASGDSGGSKSILQTLNAIGQAIQSGNITAAQQAYSSLPIALVGPCAEPHGQIGLMQSGFHAVLNHLGQALQSGNIAAAQQAFSAVEQLWNQIAPAAISPTARAIGATPAKI